MIYPENFEYKIGFDKIKELVRKKCLSDLGKRKVDRIKCLHSLESIKTLLQEVHEFKIITEEERDFPLGHFIDVAPTLQKMKIEGNYPEVHEVFDLRKSIDSVRRILNFFQKRKKEKYSALHDLCGEVKTYPFVTERINKIITSSGKIKDNASRELVHIRRTISGKKGNVSKKMQSIFQFARSEGIIEKNAGLSIRNGRPVIPVDSGHKRKIRGIIHDESASGRTSFIEPAEVVELNNEIVELEYAEKREIVKILTNLANDLRPYLDDLLNANDFLGTIDFVRAKAVFAIEINAVLPEVKPDCTLNWKNAFHPLLYLLYNKEKKEVVPLDISLNARRRILLISGPNAGGKSVCLQTVGLLQYMLQCGLLVSMDEHSQMGIFDRIFIDIGDEQSIENDLSTYSSHLLNMKYFIRHSDPQTLLLIDEFGTGTEPILGGAIAESILGKLNENKTMGVITTHYGNLKHYASAAEGIDNGAMLFDTQKMKPLFKLEIGQPGSSFAFEIARNIGLSGDIIQTATEKVGEEQVKFDKHLREIIRDKKYWEDKRDRIRKAEKKLQEILGKYSHELESAEKERKNIVNSAKQEAEELLAQANKRIEKTIREIKENMAEKEKTRKSREELAIFREKYIVTDEKNQSSISSKIQKIKSEEKKVKERRKHFGQLEPVKKGTKEILDPTIRNGDYVLMKGQDVPGEVMEIKRNQAKVRFGQVTTKVHTDKLEKIAKQLYDRLTRLPLERGDYEDWDISGKKLYFKSEIDVRGQRAEEALRNVTRLLDEAIMVEAKQVRILHGKGDGILRQVIREYLNTVDLVRSFRDEHIQLGGAGITVVELDI